MTAPAVSTWLMTNSLQRSISSGRSAVLRIRMRSRVSSDSRFASRSAGGNDGSVAVIIPLHRKPRPRPRQKRVANFQVLGNANELTFQDTAIQVGVEIERDHACWRSGAKQHPGAGKQRQQLTAVDGLAES